MAFVLIFQNVGCQLTKQQLNPKNWNCFDFTKKCISDSFSAAVDQIDTLRRQLGAKDDELRQFNKQFEYQEVEKIKIVQKLAQVEQDLDVKSHELRKTKSQLSDKEDTLEVGTKLCDRKDQIDKSRVLLHMELSAFGHQIDYLPKDVLH